MQKRLLALFLTVAMALSLAVFPVSADTTTGTYGNLTYELSDGTVTITGYSTSVSGDLVIPDTIEGYPVTAIGYEAFFGCSGLTSVTIPDSVDRIGSWAFGDCTGLTSISIPVDHIGAHAFSGCTGLTNVTIPEGVALINSYAFYGCTSLTSVSISSSVSLISNDAFIGCTSLTEFTVDDNNRFYMAEDGVLFNKAQTTLECYPGGRTGSYTVPDGVTLIEFYAFYGCAGLIGVTIPDSVTVIGNEAFYNCTSLTDITIPDSVTRIGEYAFYHTPYYNDASNWEDNVLYLGNFLLKADPNAISGDYTIRDGTTVIADGAFFACHSLTGVTIPDSVISVGLIAFYCCDGLTSVTLGSSLTSIGQQAFDGCTALTSITIPDSVTSVGDSAFSGCTSLSSITIPDSITSLGSSVFYGTGYYNDESNWEDGVLYLGCYLLHANAETLPETYTVRDGTTIIAGRSFKYCTNLTSITIPDSVVSIGEYAFEGCTSLTTITIDNSGISIDSYTFYNCPNLTDVYFNGTEAEWEALTAKNSYLLSSRITAHCINSGSTDPTDENPFTDVSEENYFYSSVLWAVDNGITSGTSDTTFSPFQTAERCQVVTFLWRAAGCPEVAAGTVNPFTDVDEDDYFYTAVLWAVQEGITSGTSSTTFSPYAKCERCQVVTFLYRYFGEPEVTTTSNPFTDADTDDYFYNAVLWAVENGITTGTSDTTFGPFVTCERCMVVTFLYRALAA